MDSKIFLRKLGITESLKGDVAIPELINDIPHMAIARVQHNGNLIINEERIQIHKDTTIVMPIGFFLSAKRDNTTGSINLKLHKRQLKDYLKRYKGEDLNGKKLFIWRTGGFGDIMFIQPIVKYLKEKYNCHITLACAPNFYKILDLWPAGLLDRKTTIPFPVRELYESDYHLTFDGVIERTKESKLENCYDLFCKMANIKIDLNDPKYKIELTLESAVTESVKSLIPKEKYVVVQLRASSPSRAMDDAKWEVIFKELNKLGYKVVILDKLRFGMFYHRLIKRGGYDKDMVIELTKHSKDISVVSSIISMSSAVIGIDSSFLHIGAALGKPVIGIYGPFLGDLRMRYYNNSAFVEPKEKKCPLQPCFFHQEDVRKCPSLQLKQYPACLSNIDESEVISKFKELLGVEDIVEEITQEIVEPTIEEIPNG